MYILFFGSLVAVQVKFLFVSWQGRQACRQVLRQVGCLGRQVPVTQMRRLVGGQVGRSFGGQENLFFMIVPSNYSSAAAKKLLNYWKCYFSVCRSVGCSAVIWLISWSLKLPERTESFTSMLLSEQLKKVTLIIVLFHENYLWIMIVVQKLISS